MPALGETKNYWHLRVPKHMHKSFNKYRWHDIGRKGHTLRHAAEKNGEWCTIGWLISKDDAYIYRGRLVPKDRKTRQILVEIARSDLALRKYIDFEKDTIVEGW